MSSPQDSSPRRGAPQARNLELALTLLVLGGAAPAVGVSLYLLWLRELNPEVAWTLTAVILVVWLAAASAANNWRCAR